MGKNEKIRESVDEFYRKIANGEYGVEIPTEEVNNSLGYNKQDMDQLPKGMDMGLSCGNPLERLQLNDNETMVDLGCGTGKDIFLTRIKFPNSGIIYGIDRLKEMIDKAEKVKKIKKFDKIEFRQGELITIPLENESIDKVISNCVINLEPDKQKVYNELYRILKEGGKFYISDIILKKELPNEWKNNERLHCT